MSDPKASSKSSRLLLVAIASALLAVACATTNIEPKCAVVSGEIILRDSAASKQLMERLTSEFEPKYSALEHLTAARNRAERSWLDAKESQKSEEEIKSLRQRADEAKLAELVAQRPLNQDLNKRRKEELTKLVGRVNLIYRALGRELGYNVLYQAGEKEPIGKLDDRVKNSSCPVTDDLTTEVIRRLDAESGTQS